MKELLKSSIEDFSTKREGLVHFTQEVMDVFEQLLMKTDTSLKIVTIDDVRKLTNDRLGRHDFIYEKALRTLRELVSWSQYAMISDDRNSSDSLSDVASSTEMH